MSERRYLTAEIVNGDRIMFDLNRVLMVVYDKDKNTSEIHLEGLSETVSTLGDFVTLLTKRPEPEEGLEGKGKEPENE